MENSINSPNFEERRRENLNVRDIVDDKLREMEGRRDKNLQHKIDAIEKLVNLTFITKSEALGIAISRMQCDSKECLGRCAIQVEKFYSLINKITAENVGRDIHITTILNAIHEVNKSIAELIRDHDNDIDVVTSNFKSALQVIETKISDLAKYHDADADKQEEKVKKETEGLETKMSDLEDSMDKLNTWKENFWVKNIAAAVVASVFVSQVLFQGFTWIVDYLSKVKPPVP